jgi:DNA-binding NarL/FixJ family response regulator
MSSELSELGLETNSYLTAANHNSCTDYDRLDDHRAEVVKQPKNGEETMLILIEKRSLIRECLARCISAEFGCSIESFSDVEDWREARPRAPASLFLISGDGHDPGSICKFVRSECDAPIVILSDASDVDDVMNILRCGARGYVTTTTSLEVAIEAMRFVLFGGVFVPADIVINARPRSCQSPADTAQNSVYTERQNSVIKALREGKANKVIAYELNMSESTVKVHIHNIMKKLQVRNRTEMAVKLGEQFRQATSYGNPA